MSNNHKGKLAIAQAAPTNIAARLIITAFTDRPPTIECAAGIVAALRLVAIAVQTISNAVEQANKPPSQTQADQVDKQREYLGPRE